MSTLVMVGSMVIVFGGITAFNQLMESDKEVSERLWKSDWKKQTQRFEVPAQTSLYNSSYVDSVVGVPTSRLTCTTKD